MLTLLTTFTFNCYLLPRVVSLVFFSAILGRVDAAKLPQTLDTAAAAAGFQIFIRTLHNSNVPIYGLSSDTTVHQLKETIHAILGVRTDQIRLVMLNF